MSCSFRAQLLARGHRAGSKAGFRSQAGPGTCGFNHRLHHLASDFAVLYAEELRRQGSGVATRGKGTARTKRLPG